MLGLTSTVKVRLSGVVTLTDFDCVGDCTGIVIGTMTGADCSGGAAGFWPMAVTSADI